MCLLFANHPPLALRRPHITHHMRASSCLLQLHIVPSAAETTGNIHRSPHRRQAARQLLGQICVGTGAHALETIAATIRAASSHRLHHAPLHTQAPSERSCRSPITKLTKMSFLANTTPARSVTVKQSGQWASRQKQGFERASGAPPTWSSPR